MVNNTAEKSQVRYARLAGFMYLFVIITYAVNAYIAGSLEVPGDFAATAHKITGSETLYRIGLCSSLTSSLCTVFLAMGLYGAVKPINNNLALLALIFRLVEATMGGVMAAINFTFLKLYTGANYANAFNIKQLSALVDLQSGAYSAAINIAAIFFSLGSAIFFYLFFEARSIPRSLSVFGLSASLLVTVICFVKLILPRYADIADYGWHPMGLAEIVVGLWLLIKGVKIRPEVNENHNLVTA